MAVFLVVAYIYSKSPWFRPLTNENLSTRDKVYLYFFFSAISMMGTYMGLPVHDALANTRAIGPVLAGIIGGPILGTSVGFTGGLHRYFFGGFTAFSVRPVNNHRRIDRWPCAPVSVPAKQAGSNLSSDGRFFYHDVR